MKCKVLLAAFFLSCAVLCPGPPVQGAKSTIDRRITLDVVVANKSGEPLTGLQQQDFVLLDNTLPRSIASFRAVGAGAKPEDPPVRVVFVIDEVNVSFHVMSNARQQLEKYLHQNNGQLPVPMSLVIYSEKSTQVQGTPTLNGNILADSVHAIGAGAPRELEGSVFANEIWRLQTSLRALQKLVAYEGTQPGRKLLIWFSAGWPLIIESADRLTTKDLQTDFHSLVSLSTGMREARVTLYSIDPLGMDDAASLRNVYYKNFLDGVPSAAKFRSANLTLQVMATQSGGQVLNRSNDITAMVSKCVADARSYYSLTFDSSPSEHPDEYHDLQIKMNKPGLLARTRTGYYAQP